MNMGERIKQLRLQKGLTQEELGQYIGVQKSAIRKYEKGSVTNLKRSSIEILANLFGVTPSYLMCIDDNAGVDELGNPVSPIPIIGAVKAGYDFLAEENWKGTVNVEKSLVGDGSEYFALEVKGDSMAPVFMEGDIVIVKKQNDCENNEIAIVIVNGDEGTIKKVRKTDTGIMLVPLNPAYAPMIYSNEEIKSIPIIIAGIVKQLKREF